MRSVGSPSLLFLLKQSPIPLFLWLYAFLRYFQMFQVFADLLGFDGIKILNVDVKDDGVYIELTTDHDDIEYIECRICEKSIPFTGYAESRTIRHLLILGKRCYLIIRPKKGYQDYLTLVTARVEDQVRLIGVIEGREKVKVKAFLKAIPGRLKRSIKGVCCDMYDGYVNATAEALPKAPIMIDRFHVAKLYRKSLANLSSPYA